MVLCIHHCEFNSCTEFYPSFSPIFPNTFLMICGHCQSYNTFFTLRITSFNRTSNYFKYMGQTEGGEAKSPVWYALQTFFRKEREVEDFLKEKGYAPFVPKLYRERVDANGQKHRELVPAVHNLLFLPKVADGKAQVLALRDCPYPVRIIRKQDSEGFYEIPDRQMVEFRSICDPDYTNTIYASREFADDRPGKRVRVIQGPFKGMEGKLVRYKNRFYIVITLVNLGVFLRISRWYCEPIKD